MQTLRPPTVAAMWHHEMASGVSNRSGSATTDEESDSKAVFPRCMGLAIRDALSLPHVLFSTRHGICDLPRPRARVLLNEVFV